MRREGSPLLMSVCLLSHFVSVHVHWKIFNTVIKMIKKYPVFTLQAEVFPYPEIGNEELDEMKQFVAPVERFFNEEGERRF